MIENLFQEEYDTMVKRIRARGMQQADAEDVVMEAFYRAIRFSSSFNPAIQKLGAWFNTILNNAFKDYHRANFTGDFSFREEDESDELDELNSDVLKEVQFMIRSPRTTDDLIIYFIYRLGYSHKTCCQVLDVKAKKVEYVVKKFKNKIKERFG